MKKQIVRLIVCTAALASFAAATPAVLAQQSPTLRGTWETQVTITNCSGTTLGAFRGMQTFVQDGSYFSVDNQPPTTHTTSFGRWRHLNGVNYGVAFQFFTFNSDGSFSGVRKVHQRIALAADGESYTSQITFEAFGPDGTMVASGCGTGEGTRLRPFRSSDN